MADAFFTTKDNDWFSPTQHTRGPWDENSCHAGPPTGLLARALELTVPEQRLMRITVDLIRPIPFSGFRIHAEIVRQGRTVTTSKASLLNSEGNTVVTATGLHIREQREHPFPSHETEIEPFASAQTGLFPIKQTLHGKPAFNGDGVETKYPPGQDDLPGPTIAWLKTVPLLATETPSPFQRMCPMADCGNAFSRNAEPNEVLFVNADLTIVLHRPPEGEWMGSHSKGYWESNGLGLADAMLFDQKGVVGRALQTLLLRPNNS